MADTAEVEETAQIACSVEGSVHKQSRAVLRSIEAGSYVDCVRCGERVKFQAKIRKMQVICNVYTEGRWERVEHYHEECYVESDSPYGDPVT